MALGKSIRFHRERLGLKLEELSERSGVDVGTISALENRDSARSKYASKICKALGFTVEQLSSDDFDWQKPQTSPEWPFEKFSPSEYKELPDADREELETIIKMRLTRLGLKIPIETKDFAGSPPKTTIKKPIKV